MTAPVRIAPASTPAKRSPRNLRRRVNRLCREGNEEQARKLWRDAGLKWPPHPRKPKNSKRRRAFFRKLAAIHGPDCWICHTPIDLALFGVHPNAPSIDHVLPLARGGTHDMTNLRLAHVHCNRERADQRPEMAP